MIYITLPFSCATIHLSARVIDEGRRTSYDSLTQVAGGWLPDERQRDGCQAEGHRGQLDIWLTYDLGPHMLARTFCLIGLH